jgi:hypothetical protein
MGLIVYYYYRDEKEEYSRFLHVLRSKKQGKRYGLFVFAFAFIIALTVAISQILFNYTEDIYHNKYSSVQGAIENFNFEGQNEMFDVNGIHFEYNKNDLMNYGFNNSNDDNIESGMFVRIKYYNNKDKNLILKLDIQQ